MFTCQWSDTFTCHSVSGHTLVTVIMFSSQWSLIWPNCYIVSFEGQLMLMLMFTILVSVYLLTHIWPASVRKSLWPNDNVLKRESTARTRPIFAAAGFFSCLCSIPSVQKCGLNGHIVDRPFVVSYLTHLLLNTVDRSVVSCQSWRQEAVWPGVPAQAAGQPRVQKATVTAGHAWNLGGCKSLFCHSCCFSISLEGRPWTAPLFSPSQSGLISIATYGVNV